MSVTFAVRRKGTKRALPWTLTARVLGLPPQAEVIPATKKPRPDTVVASTLRRSSRRVITTSSTGTPVHPPTATVDTATPRRSQRQTQLPPIETSEEQLDDDDDYAAANDDDDDGDANANAYPVKDTHDVVNSSIDLAIRRKNSWTEDEDNKLKAAVQIHGGKNWNKIAALVPGRTVNQCNNRWLYALDPILALTAGRTGKWTEDEDIKLKDAVQLHSGNDWLAITALVPGRKKSQCFYRWHNCLNPSIALTAGRKGNWTEDEDLKLKNAVQMHGGKNWDAIAALVPGRKKSRCYKRWHDVLDPNIALTAGRKGGWTKDEDLKLKDGVHTHGGKNWDAIAALVPGRTKIQCYQRWQNGLNPSIDRASGRTGKWTADEDSKLKNSVQMHGGNDWVAIAALVPSRTKIQCYQRWRRDLDPRVALTAKRTGRWTADEDLKLRHAVQLHGDNDWLAIAALVPSRKKSQCYQRWQYGLSPNIDQSNRRKCRWTAVEDSTNTRW
jgi:hypothetical protein